MGSTALMKYVFTEERKYRQTISDIINCHIKIKQGEVIAIGREWYF